jgi:hypothetical protein
MISTYNNSPIFSIMLHFKELLVIKSINYKVKLNLDLFIILSYFILIIVIIIHSLCLTLNEITSLKCTNQDKHSFIFLKKIKNNTSNLLLIIVKYLIVILHLVIYKPDKINLTTHNKLYNQ